jgi:hypothetical protein
MMLYGAAFFGLAGEMPETQRPADAARVAATAHGARRGRYKQLS